MRLAHRADAAGIRALHERSGCSIGEWQLARLLRADPRHRVTICATALLDGRDTIVGIGSVDISDEIELGDAHVVVDRDRTDGLTELLGYALLGRAAAIASARAA